MLTTIVVRPFEKQQEAITALSVRWNMERATAARR
jgi:hypothetical protein